jgi:hypothetical protein
VAPSFEIFWYKPKKVNARTTYWQLPELDNSTEILLPSSGKISNVSTKNFASIFRENFKSEHFKMQPWKKSLKMETKMVVERLSTESCRWMAQAFTLICSSKRFQKVAPHLSAEIRQ